MLDYRAWIAAAVLLLAAAGGYLVYLHRTRANYAARSLSAAGQPANESANQLGGTSPQKNAANQTRTLHVDGCNKDFLVKVGELVEPRVVPGAPLTEFQSIYGHESRRGKSDKSGIVSWDEGAFTITEGSFAAHQPSSLVHVSIHQGHVVETLDGVELGIDSFGALFRKLRDMKLDAHERIEHSTDSWTLTVSFYSACGQRYRSEYSRTLPAGPDIDKFITRRVTNPDGSQSSFRSDVFMNKLITDYVLTPSNGHDETSDGSSAEHD
jgi:hypothetical protein